MLEIVVYLVLIALVSMLIGVLLGRLSLKSKVDAKVQAAYERAREELKVDRTELAEELTQQLGKIRESILQSAHAYESAVQAVEQKLAVTPQSTLLHIGEPLPEQLNLEFRGESIVDIEGDDEDSDEEDTLISIAQVETEPATEAKQEIAPQDKIAANG